MDPRTEDDLVAWVTWLRGMKWDWFATLTYGRGAAGANEAVARRDALAWVDGVRAAAPKAYAIVTVEQGPHLGGWHAHIIVGGVGTHPSWPAVLTSLWRARGSIHVTRYDPQRDPKNDPRRGVLPYLRKLPDTEWEIVGTMRRHRPRRRDKERKAY